MADNPIRNKANGWEQVDQKGSHVQFKHPTKSGRVTVPHPKRDIPIGTIKSIEKQADLKLK
ncbi:type II toxin-antitoxin system HicA family toxin [Bradyrhizobium genosp. SA-3]|uniref:type II toxin-antitoxin system HicA family toxin n=1 Tax=Bradyrhizobium genosp. SA-3 TaxID=508868 RepID=UPI0032E36BC4